MDTDSTCSYCGEKILEGVKRCPYCGSRIKKKRKNKRKKEEKPGSFSYDFNLETENSNENEEIDGNEILDENKENDFTDNHKILDEEINIGPNEEIKENSLITDDHKEIEQEINIPELNFNSDEIEERFKENEYEYEQKAAQSIQNEFSESIFKNEKIDNEISKKPVSNALKVFLTIITAVIPGFGQAAGIIAAIIYMNTDYDKDRKSFGTALFFAAIIMFVLYMAASFFIFILRDYL